MRTGSAQVAYSMLAVPFPDCLCIAKPQRSWVSPMVTVTEPSSMTAGSGVGSQPRNRIGISSSGFAVHHQQMNRALFSSAHDARASSVG